MTHLKNYITPEGYKRIQQEFDHLIKVERPAVVRDVSWAASNGDRSENGDYIYGKRKLRQIDARLRFLTRQLDLAHIVHPTAQSKLEQVFFGAWVTLYEEQTGHTATYRIVGQYESEPGIGWISWLSPLAKALLKKQVGDTITLHAPGGDRQYEISSVSYRDPGITHSA